VATPLKELPPVNSSEVKNETQSTQWSTINDRKLSNLSRRMDNFHS
jgi:hypothetical protein